MKFKAFEFLDEIAAGGSTNLEDALMDAISLASESDSDRIPIILFLTDGGPSVDGKDIQSVVQTISESASSSISINGISLGTNDLTGWQLVQRLTQKNRGLSSKVKFSIERTLFVGSVQKQKLKFLFSFLTSRLLALKFRKSSWK